MDEPRAPIGELFSRVYGDRSEPVLDSVVVRRRLGAYIQHELHGDHGNLAIYLKQEAGMTADTWSNGYALLHKFEDFVLSLPRDDFLNFVTHVWRFLASAHPAERVSPARRWQAFVARVFQEENVGYQLDDHAGVRYRVDQQFDLQREATLACLSAGGYAAALAAFEDAHRHFSSTPQDLKAALRSLFESVEIIAKQQYSAPRLTADLVKSAIKPAILSAYPDDATARRAIGKVIEGLADWVDGMHYYRHGQDDVEPVVPPLSFAVYAVSSGAAFIRLLVQTHNR